MLRKQISWRRGVAAAELAVLLPILVVLLVIAVDWSRVFYYSLIIDNCARNGALFAGDPYTTTRSRYADITAAALADAPNIQPAPTVSSTNGVDASGRNYVECTVQYNFRTVSNLPAVPATTHIVRTVRAYQTVQTPN